MIGTSVIKELKVYLGLCQESMTELFLAKTFNGKFNPKVNKFVITRLKLKRLSNSRWVWMKNPTLLTILGSIPFSTALLFSISWVVKTYAYHVIIPSFLLRLSHLHKIWSFLFRICSVNLMWPDPHFRHLVTFTKEILNGKFHLLCIEINYT